MEPHRATSPSTDLAIDAENVHVTYDDGTEAVRGVDLSVASGECFGFLGPNGAGKTTTIKTLVTLLHPTRGSVRVGGHDVAEDPQAVRESIGYMAQETSVDEELTARENLRFACEIYGVPEAVREERIAELLDLVSLTDVADERAETFSGGMKKRLDAATALVHRPPVVFLDEPTTGLDPGARLQFWEYLQAINDRGTTVFLTTQYLEEVDRLCDRLAVIEDGEMLVTASPDGLKSAVGGDVLDLTLADASEPLRQRAASVVRDVVDIEDASVEMTADGLAITSERARAVVSDVVVALDEAGVTVTGLDVRSPTLDDVFLSLTGESSDESDESSRETATLDAEVAR
jgi:ABC-2 type transport system ATP-binding protein